MQRSVTRNKKNVIFQSTTTNIYAYENILSLLVVKRTFITRKTAKNPYSFFNCPLIICRFCHFIFYAFFFALKFLLIKNYWRWAVRLWKSIIIELRKQWRLVNRYGYPKNKKWKLTFGERNHNHNTYIWRFGRKIITRHKTQKEKWFSAEQKEPQHETWCWEENNSIKAVLFTMMHLR